MDFKQKAEEKKMSMSKNIARLAVTAGLTAALSFGGVMAPVTMAFAAAPAAAQANSITIKKVAEDNQDNTFKAYQIFKAKVDDVKDEGKVASDIEWANDAIDSKVITAIKGSEEYKKIIANNSAKELDNNATAQVVAEWLSENVNGNSSTATSSDGTRVAPGDVLYEIAAAVSGKTDGVTAESPAGTLTADTSWTRPATTTDGLYGDGYYLFVPDGLTEQAKPNTGTSPIFAIVGGDSVIVTEKTSIPTVNKWILNDKKNKTADSAAEDDWEKCGDSQIGQEIDYKLTGTVADNIASFTKYEYEFQDTLSKGLVVIKGENNAPKGLHVYIVDGKTKAKTEVKSGFSANVAPAQDTVKNSELLTVKFDDLKAVKGENNVAIDVDKDSTVVVTYKAQLTSDASYEAVGNPNTVKLVYSNNPMAAGTGTSVEKTVTDHVFRLDVTKVDSKESTKKLKAGFKVKVMDGEGSEDTASQGKWLAQDGSLVEADKAYEFTTDETNGQVLIPGLDAGKYQITETTTPEGYNTIAPFEITVTPTYKINGELNKLTVSSNNEEMTAIGDTNGATMSLTVKNKKGSSLPLTGLNGVTFTWIAGGVVLCIGVAHLIRSRKQAEESEQE